VRQQAFRSRSRHVPAVPVIRFFALARAVGREACKAWWMRVRLAVILAVLAMLAMTAVLGAAATVLAAGDRAAVLLTIRDPRITESSGLAASVRHPGVLYTHNDSGDAPRVFAIGPDGLVLATLTLRGAAARDWEAMAVGRDAAGRPALFLGDIGDNLHGAWPSVSVYRVTEPAVLRDATLAATRYRFRYADGARDAEALLVDPRTNRLYVASKEATGGGLYQAPATLRSDRVDVLRRVASVPSMITDGAFSPDGRTFVLRDYLEAHAFSASGKKIDAFDLPLQAQGESIAFTRDGRDLLAGSEGAGSRVWRVPLPAAAAPKAPPAARSGSGPATSRALGMPAQPRVPSNRGRDAAVLLVAGLFAAGLFAAALLVRAAWRRR